MSGGSGEVQGACVATAACSSRKRKHSSEEDIEEADSIGVINDSADIIKQKPKSEWLGADEHCTSIERFYCTMWCNWAVDPSLDEDYGAMLTPQHVIDIQHSKPPRTELDHDAMSKLAASVCPTKDVMGQVSIGILQAKEIHGFKPNTVFVERALRMQTNFNNQTTTMFKLVLDFRMPDTPAARTCGFKYHIEGGTVGVDTIKDRNGITKNGDDFMGIFRLRGPQVKTVDGKPIFAWFAYLPASLFKFAYERSLVLFDDKQLAKDKAELEPTIARERAIADLTTTIDDVAEIHQQWNLQKKCEEQAEEDFSGLYDDHDPDVVVKSSLLRALKEKIETTQDKADKFELNAQHFSEVAAAKECEAGKFQFQAEALQKVYQRMSWSDALKICKAHGNNALMIIDVIVQDLTAQGLEDLWDPQMLTSRATLLFITAADEDRERMLREMRHHVTGSFYLKDHHHFPKMTTDATTSEGDRAKADECAKKRSEWRVKFMAHFSAITEEC